VYFALNEEQSLLKDAVETFVGDRYSAAKRREFRANSRGYSLDIWQGLAELGLLGLPFETRDGGLGGGLTELMTVMEVLGAGFVAEPYLEELVIAAGVLAQLGHKSQKADWLPRIIAGDAHLALAHFEQTARFNLADVRVRARRRADGFALDGEKIVVPLAGAADAFVVSARDHGTNTDPAGIGFYLLPQHAAGVERRDFRLVDGSIASTLIFRGAVSAEKLAGGYAEFLWTIDRARIAACAEMIGIAATMFQSTLEYLRSRKQFGAALASFQVIQHRLADMYVSLEQSRSQLYRAVLYAAGAERERAVAGVKSYVSAAAVKIGEQCIQLHGGIGTTDELNLGNGHKRLLVLATMFGDADSELQRFVRLAS
jgi:alkylation response protein AidB-like acyl-CoA dehydrogenase